MELSLGLIVGDLPAHFQWNTQRPLVKSPAAKRQLVFVFPLTRQRPHRVSSQHPFLANEGIGTPITSKTRPGFFAVSNTSLSRADSSELH